MDGRRSLELHRLTPAWAGSGARSYRSQISWATDPRVGGERAQSDSIDGDTAD